MEKRKIKAVLVVCHHTFGRALRGYGSRCGQDRSERLRPRRKKGKHAHYRNSTDHGRAIQNEMAIHDVRVFVRVGRFVTWSYGVSRVEEQWRVDKMGAGSMMAWSGVGPI
jgi:hypothetical protein